MLGSARDQAAPLVTMLSVAYAALAKQFAVRRIHDADTAPPGHRD
jgi:hypothetical protein